MSVNMDMSGFEYADHDVQVVAAKPRFLGGNAGNEIDDVIQLEPVSNRGVDSSAVAELVAMYRYASIRTQEGSNAEAVHFEADLGINLTDSELPTNLTNNATNELIEASSTGTYEGDGAISISNFEEPGVLDTLSATAFIDWSEQRQYNFREELGSGPYMDRTDDLSIHLELEAQGQTGPVEAEIYYVLYWNVQEIEGQRQRFARPSDD